MSENTYRKELKNIERNSIIVNKKIKFITIL